MAPRFCCVYLWAVTFMVKVVSADLAPPSSLRFHGHHKSFEDAMATCSPGVLASLSTQQEVSDVLRLVSESRAPLAEGGVTLWVGLRRLKKECALSSKPLRGFKWIHDGSEKAEVIQWGEEPKLTCTSVRCAALKVDLNGTTVTGWGLIPDSCRSHYQFICKHGSVDDRTAAPPGPPEPTADTPGSTPGPPRSHPQHPSTPGTTPGSTPTPAAPPKPDPGLEPSVNMSSNAGSDLGSASGSDPDPGSAPGPGSAPDPSSAPAPGSVPDSAPDRGFAPAPGSAPGSGLCYRPKDPTITHSIRSFILDPEDAGQITVECWSSDLVQLHCSGRPLVWRLLDDSPANFSAVCHPCEPGFRKDALGRCVDINECEGDPCRHKCVNSEGSYRCVCYTDEDGTHYDEGTPACTDTTTDSEDGVLSGILMPVLVAVAAFVVLVVIVAVTVKCCLMRRSKKRAIKKAEKMAMQSKDEKDSFLKANEKAAT